ncbi:MAG: hypothetical protein KTR18_09965 [Acidiferrobacterales bacterium]|nr:hypothetical protein [Acidiferrobacterales bacterium]
METKNINLYIGSLVVALALIVFSTSLMAQKLESKNSQGKYEIDILFVYTAKSKQDSHNLSKANSNGHRRVQSDGEVLEQQARQSFENSQISDVELRVVGEHVTDFVVPAGISKNALTDLVKSKDDGAMDEIHDIRDSLKADLVVFIGPNGPTPSCGDVNFPPDLGTPDLGFEEVSTNNAVHAFAVAHVICAFSPGGYSMLHEIGHLLHVRHHRASDGTRGQPFNFNHGFLFDRDASQKTRFRTLAAGGGKGLPPRILYWSNPEVRYQNVPTGIPEANNDAANAANTIRLTAQTIASYRVKP